MTRAERAAALVKAFPRVYPDAHCELDHRNPLELLVATILSAQCTDKRVNIVTKELFCVCKTAADYVALPQEQLEELRIRYIIDHVQRGEPIPVPRPPLKSLTTVHDLEHLGFAKWLVENQRLNEGNQP